MTEPATGLVWAPDFAAYDALGPAFLPPIRRLHNYHWDIGERVGCLMDIVKQTDLVRHLTVIEPVPADLDDMRLVHEENYIREFRRRGAVDGIPFSQAALALGGALDLLDAVLMGRIGRGYALVRPAGHHAGPGGGRGGCALANGAIAAKRALRAGIEKILFIDWDAHHGNSQQEVFWEEPAVLTISIHQRQLGEGTHAASVASRGRGKGWGSNVNVPMPAGAGGFLYRRVFTEVIRPAADAFKPELVIVSSGLDANNVDPSARLRLNSSDFAYMTSEVMSIADRHAEQRLLMVHEGGYSLPYIPLCLLRILETLVSKDLGIDDPFLAVWGTAYADEVNDEELVKTLRSYLVDVPR